MIVECDHCNTKFNLPDEKLKPGGVKIRCTRCKEIFEVHGPEAAHDDFAAGDDLSGFEGGDDFPADSDKDSSLGEGGGEGDIDLGMDDSMDFNMGSELGEEGGSLVDENLDLDSSDSAEPSGGDNLGLDDSFEDSPSGDDFSLNDDSPGDGLGLDESADGLSEGDSPSDDGLSLDDDSTGGGLDLDEGSDSLSFDDNSEFDISSLDDDGDSTIGEDTSDLDFSSPLEDGGEGNDSSLDFESTPATDDGMGMGDGIGLDIGEASFEDGGMKPTDGLAPAKMKKSRRSPLLVAMLIVLVIVSGAYFAFKAFGGGNISIEYLTNLFAGNKNPLDGLTIDETKVSHYYTVNNKTGKILVVEGMVLNASEVAKGQIKVKIKLYDSEKKIIKDSEALCGNILKLNFLVNSSKAEIIKSLNKSDPANARVGPKTSISFTLVIFDLPPNSDSFDVEIVGAENVG